MINPALRAKRIIPVLRSLLIILIIIVMLYPAFWFALISLKTHREAFKTPPSFIFVPTFKHFQKLFERNVDFGKYYLNSIIISLGATAVSLAAGVTAAYSLSRGRFRYKNTILIGILGARMVPPILFIIPYYMVYANLGLIDTHIGLIVIYVSFNLTLVVWSMRAFFDQVPRELEEAAYIDGASDFYTFWKIILPLSTPGLAATAVLCLILSWNEFVYALMLSQLRAMTASVAVVIFASNEAFDWGLVSAGALTLTMPVLVFSILVRRYLVVGLLGGSLKE